MLKRSTISGAVHLLTLLLLILAAIGAWQVYRWYREGRVREAYEEVREEAEWKANELLQRASENPHVVRFREEARKLREKLERRRSGPIVIVKPER